MRHHAAEALQNVDRRIVSALGELAAEDEVAVEDGAASVGDRLAVVVAFDEDGVKRSDRPVCGGPRAFH